jgi:hypothetical protein
VLTRLAGVLRTHPRLTALGVTTSVLLGLTGGQIIAASPDACGPSDPAAFSENRIYVPYATRRSLVPSLPITSIGSTVDSEAAPGTIPLDAVDALPRRWVVRMDNGSVYQYFFGAPIDAQLTPEDFWAQGGVELDMDPLTDAGPFWKSVEAQFPERVTIVKIGAFDGVVVWADPVRNGTRTHNVYWSDGRYDYGLIANRPIAIAVNLARAVACDR